MTFFKIVLENGNISKGMLKTAFQSLSLFKLSGGTYPQTCQERPVPSAIKVVSAMYLKKLALYSLD